MSYSVLNLKTHYSLLQSVIQPDALVDKLQKLNIKNCAVTDYGNISGSVLFYQKLKEAGVKPLLGCQFNICSSDAALREPSNKDCYSLTLIARNRKGWDNLIKLVSLSNHHDYFYYVPRLDLAILAENLSKGDVIAYSGGRDSFLRQIAYYQDDNVAIEWTNRLKELFGKENFFVHLDSTLDNSRMRELAQRTGTKAFASPNPHYANQEDSIYQRIVLCNQYNTTLKKGYNSPFFNSEKYYLLSRDELSQYCDKEEIAQTDIISDTIESFDISNKPIFPAFDCPNGLNPDEYLRELCRKGWVSKIKGRNFDEGLYANRIKEELEILQGAGLSSYFLVLQDILNYVRSDGSLVGVARGSAAGCLSSYLIGITSVNPIPYNLQFERFYNAGRNSPGKISYPDIDVDIPIMRREDTIQYIKDKYGHDKVAQIISYQTIKGKGALKMVFRAYNDIPFEEQNKITEHIIDESKIADELQEMKENGEEPSIIGWALENRAEKLADWVKLEDGKLTGPLALYFEKAIKLEKTKSAQSKHAAGVAITSKPLVECAPIIYDPKTKSPILGWEMNEAEYAGIIKMDILGLAATDRLMTIRDILRNGEITI